MLSISLLRESLVQLDGVSPSIEVSPASGKLLVLTLGITRILEQQSLDVSIWGSMDATNWGGKPLASFPPKSYCGLYSILLNLSARPETRLVRVEWKMKRWSKAPQSAPMLCAFFLDAEESGARIPSRASAEPARACAAA